VNGVKNKAFAPIPFSQSKPENSHRFRRASSMYCSMDSPKSDTDSSTEELYEAAIFNTNTLLLLLFENDRGLSEPEPQSKRGG
jgi:hypothetical protein